MEANRNMSPARIFEDKMEYHFHGNYVGLKSKDVRSHASLGYGPTASISFAIFPLLCELFPLLCEGKGTVPWECN